MLLDHPLFLPAVRRFLILLLVSVLLVWVGSEIAFRLLRSDFDRPPQTVTLTIPSGAAVRVAAGFEEPGIPAELSFVVGDTLTVYNDDSVPHELGPLYIPAGASASLVMDDASVFEYTCSFRPSQYLGLTVYEGTTLNIRLLTLSYASPATAILLFVYSLVWYPLRPKPGASESVSDPA